MEPEWRLSGLSPGLHPRPRPCSRGRVGLRHSPNWGPAGLVALACLSVVLVAAAEVRAQPADEDLNAEIQTLERQIEAEVVALATSDCALACLALESMIRATERLCELAPGPPCNQARAKVADARERVRAACPDCAATMATQRAEPDEPAPRPMDADVEDKPSTPAAAPPAEEARGGCAACTLGSSQQAPAALLAGIFALGLAVFRRRRR
jgi:MYXO-CTERM domain-containing protein